MEGVIFSEEGVKGGGGSVSRVVMLNIRQRGGCTFFLLPAVAERSLEVFPGSGWCVERLY